jgi:hypothetical protein
MTDLRQAAQMALEALEGVYLSLQLPDLLKVVGPITALRTALEQPEQVDCPRCGHVCSQRPWVGLEAEEILDLFDRNNVYGSKWIEFARTVEAKLKERNNG